MATGTVADIANRIIGVLPPWFPDPVDAPVAYALIQGVATVMAQCYALLGCVRLQTRLQTSTDVFLDMFAMDYFGDGLPRRASELDSAYRPRISASLFPEKATRAGVIKAVTLLTGRAPTVFEPSRPQDAFCLGYGGLGYRLLGSYATNNQAFVTAYRPVGGGGAFAAGLGSTYAGLGGSYTELADQSSLYGTIRDADIFAAVENARPVASTVWVHISS